MTENQFESEQRLIAVKRQKMLTRFFALLEGSFLVLIIILLAKVALIILAN